MKTANEIAAALAAHFDARDVKWKPSVVKANRCLAMAYIDSRAVQDRLDEVMGIGNWCSSFEVHPSGSVECLLCLRIDGEWITKCDVGSPSEQSDAGDQMKAAYSDALKRAAVQWGIGRYLYRLPAQWVDYDPVKKQIVTTPTLPAQGRPTPQKQSAPVTQPQEKGATEPTLAQQCISALRKATSREEGIPIYRQYEADLAEGRFTKEEHAAINEEFVKFGQKFPAPMPKAAKK